MRRFHKVSVLLFVATVFIAAFACSKPQEEQVQIPTPEVQAPPTTELKQPEASPSPVFPNLQAAITDERFKSTTSDIGNFDFRNHTYPLPRGWQHPETKEITLENGKIKPVAVDVDEDMADEEKAEKKAARRIGMSYVNTRFLDVTGDGQEEAIVILKVETGGAAIPQLVYVYEWKDGKPELIWNFRTGDRADGGLKDIRVENGMLTIELFGQDRFLLGEIETGKITGDEEQLCCPTHFTRTHYKWNGRNFLMQGKRLTFLTSDPAAKPLENYGDVVNNPKNQRQKPER